MVIDPSHHRSVRTHYEVLGVDPSADADTIRAAYRRRARAVHPDAGHARLGDDSPGRGVPDAAAEMATLNEAYRVLRDPARRVMYDRSLTDARFRSSAAGSSSTTTASSGASASKATVGPYPTGPLPPARVPWRAMLALAAIGSAVVVVGAAFVDPGTPPGPDGVLGPGSCVVLEVNGDAVEADCDGRVDGVVVELVAFDERCPSGTLAHRDRQGLGIACVTDPPTDR